MSQFESAFTAVATPVLNQEFGVAVTLRHGSQTTEEFTARRIRVHDALQSNDVPITVNLDLRRYIVPQSIVDSTAWLSAPREGMEIVEGSEVFRITPRMDGSKKAVEHSPEYDEYDCNCEKVA